VRTHRGAILACCGSECSGAQRIVFEQNITPSIFVETMAAMRELDHMNDRSILNRPTALEAILRETADLGFSMASELQTGSLLQTLAASKPAGRFLELGTGTGVATAWLLASTTTRQSLQLLATQSFMALDCLNSCCGVE
jgi:hypothetical protein